MKKKVCTKIVNDCTYRYIPSDEREKRGIEFKGVGVWECIKCGNIVHSM